MFWLGAMLCKQRRVLLMTAVGLVLACCAVLRANGPDRPNHPTRYTGIYKVLVRGYWTGEGRANVTQDSVSMDPISVKDDWGHTATMTIPNMTLVNRRFTGRGTVSGAGVSMSITVEGRVEPADDGGGAGASGPSKSHGHDKNDVLTNARFGATYTTTGPSGNHGGRISGGRG